MSSEDVATAALLEFLNVAEAGIAAAKRLITQGKGVETWNPDQIEWEKVEGSKGPYERSEDRDNLHFKALLKDLASHSGTLTQEGYFYWTFRNGNVVGRKQRK